MLQEHIELLDTNLDRARQKRIHAADELTLVESKIQTRERFIVGLQREEALIDSLIVNSAFIEGDLNQRMSKKREAIEQNLRMSYYYKLSQNYWLHILSSSSLQEAMLKWQLFRQVRESINKEMSSVRREMVSLRDTLSYLSELKKRQRELALEQSLQMNELRNEKNQKVKVISRLAEDEQFIRSQIKKQLDERKRLNALIGDVIREENVAVASTLSSLNNEELSANFANLKGRMDWPVRNGVVTSSFGTYRHPTLRDVTVENNGIDLLCHPGEQVYAVHNGTVLIVTFQPSYRYIVIVNHGEWNTAYYRMDNVTVAKGDVVDAGQQIGELSTVDEPQFHFEIWKGQVQVDPEAWLIPR